MTRIRSARSRCALTAFLVSFCVAAALAAAGDLDPSWNGTGIVTTPFPGAFAFADGVVMNGDKVVAVGGSDDGVARDFALARYNKDGSLDQSFGSGGIVTTDFGG